MSMTPANLLCFRGLVVKRGSQGGVHVDRVPEHDDVDDQPKRAELVLLSMAIALPQLAPLAMEDVARKHVTALAAIELHQDAPAIGFVVEVVQQVDGLDDAAKLRQRASKAVSGCCWPAACE